MAQISLVALCLIALHRLLKNAELSRRSKLAKKIYIKLGQMVSVIPKRTLTEQVCFLWAADCKERLTAK